jgi:hypothetical protein
VEYPLKLPVGRIPELPPKSVPPPVIERWRAELRRDLQRRGLLERILTDSDRTPQGPRFRLLG